MPKVLASAPNAGGRHQRGRRIAPTMAEINVIPLVDVMLVLLVIFMVAAPMMTQGYPVNLPQSRQSKPLNAEPVTVSIPMSFRKDGRVRLGQEAVRLDVLAERVRQAVSGQINPAARLAGDGDITYQELMRVFDELMRGGVRNVQMQTQPPTGRQP